MQESDSRSGTPLSAQVFHILLSLADEDLHGYAIIQDVAARTGGELRLTASKGLFHQERRGQVVMDFVATK